MSLFLFRNRNNPVEYCATDTRSGHKLPAEASSWLYHAELQNALHAAVFGLPNFESAKRAIARRGYLLFSTDRILRNVS